MTSKEAYARVSLDNLIALKRAASYSNIPKPTNQKPDQSGIKPKDLKQQRPTGTINNNSAVKETFKNIRYTKHYVNNENILPNGQQQHQHGTDASTSFNPTNSIPLRQGINPLTTTTKTSGHRQSYSMVSSSSNRTTTAISPKPNSMSSSKLAYSQQSNNINHQHHLHQHLANKHYLHTRILTDHNNNSGVGDNSTNTSMIACYPAGSLNHTNNDNSQSKSILSSVPISTSIQSIQYGANINVNTNNNLSTNNSQKKNIDSTNSSSLRALSSAKQNNQLQQQQSHLKTNSSITSRDLNQYICTESSQYSLNSQQQQSLNLGSAQRFPSEERQKTAKAVIILNNQQCFKLKEKEYLERIRQLECANKNALESLKYKEATVNALRVEMHLQQQQQQQQGHDYNNTDNLIGSSDLNVQLAYNESEEATLSQQEEQVRQLQQLSAIMEDKVKRLEANLTKTTATSAAAAPAMTCNNSSSKRISCDNIKPPSGYDRLPIISRPQDDFEPQQDSFRQKAQQLEYMCSQLNECIIQQRSQQTELIREMEFILQAQQQGKTSSCVLKTLGLSEQQQQRIKQGLLKQQY